MKKITIVIICFTVAFSLASILEVKSKILLRNIDTQKMVGISTMGATKVNAYRFGLHSPVGIFRTKKQLNPTIYIGSNDGYVYSVDGNGQIIWKNKTGNMQIICAPLFHDIDNDGVEEIVLVSQNGYIYVFSDSGAIKWSYYIGEKASYTPVVYKHSVIATNGKKLISVKYNGDKNWESDIIAVRKITLADISDKQNALLAVAMNGFVYCVNPDTGGIIWKYNAGASMDSAPIVYDFINNGKKQVLVQVNGPKGLVLLDAISGKEIKNNKEYYGRISPIVVSIQDGVTKSIIAVSYVPSKDERPASGKLVALNKDLSKIWEFKYTNQIETAPEIFKPLNYQDKIILIGTLDSKLLLVNARTGVLIDSIELTTESFGVLSNPGIADVNGDGFIEIIAGTYDGALYIVGTDYTCTPNAVLWGQFQGNANHTGVVE